MITFFVLVFSDERNSLVLQRCLFRGQHFVLKEISIVTPVLLFSVTINVFLNGRKLYTYFSLRSTTYRSDYKQGKDIIFMSTVVFKPAMGDKTKKKNLELNQAMRRKKNVYFHSPREKYFQSFKHVHKL